MTTEDQTGGSSSSELISLAIRSPCKKEPFNVKISSQEALNSIKQYLIGLGPLAQPLTSFSLHANNQKLDLFALVGELGLSDGDVLEVIPEEYSPSEALFHVQQTREQLGFPHEQSAFPTINPGSLAVTEFKVQNSKGKSKQTNGKNEMPKIAADHPVFSARSASAEVYEVLASMPNPHLPRPVAGALQLSAWNPVLPQYKMQGHFFYLKFVTADRKTHHITACPDGFYINMSRDDKFDPAPKKDTAPTQSLLQLIAQVSPQTQQALERANKLLGKVSSLAWMQPKNTFLSTPWLVRDIPVPTPDLARTQAGLNETVDLKDWNEDYQVIREMPKTDEDGSPNIRERVIREKLMCTVTHEFAVAATKGALNIVDGSLQALNSGERPESQIFLSNGIFYTYGRDSAGTYADVGGNEAARVAVNKDMRGVEQLMQLDIDGISPVLTAVVDYCGRRVVAQAPVPGVFRETTESLIAYGSTEDKEQVLTSEAFVPVMSDVGYALHLKSHAVLDHSGDTAEVATSVDTKGMTGTDGRRYILDVTRNTPPDLAFLERDAAVAYPHRMTLLRPEAVVEWVKKKIHNELGDNSEKSQEMFQKLNAKYTLNPDTDLPQSEIPKSYLATFSEDQEQVREASRMIADELIPRYLEDLRNSTTTYPVDGLQLAQVLHRRGINMRYLGEIYNRATGEIFNNLREVIVEAAIVRSMKHIINRNIDQLSLQRSRNFIADYIKSVCTSSGGSEHQCIEREVASRFRLTLPGDWALNYLPRISLFRALSSTLGLQWSSEIMKSSGFDVKDLKPGHLVSIVPRIRYATIRSTIADEAMEAGRISIHKGDGKVGMELVDEAISLYEQVYGNLHMETSRALNQASLIYHEQKEYETASALSRRAITIAERLLGVDSSEVLVMYINLAYFERARGNVKLALELLVHVLNVWRSIGFPNHPDLSTVINSVAVMLQQSGEYKESVDWFNNARNILGKTYGDNCTQLASLLFELTQSYLVLGDLKTATRLMDKSFTIYKSKLGPDNESTKVTKKWLDRLLTATLKDLRTKDMPKIEAPKLAPPTKQLNAPVIDHKNVDDVVNYIMGKRR